VMLRLFRGAGPKGLAGIPRQRPCGKGVIFRPFLEATSAALRHAVTQAALEFVTDPSNLRVDQDRNYLRQVVIPAVEARWPGYRDTVSRAAQLQAQVQRRLTQLPLPVSETVMGEPALAIDGELEPDLLAAQIHQWVSEHSRAVPDQRRLLEFARQALTAQPDRLPEIRWDGRCLRVWRRQIIEVSEPREEAWLPETIIVGEASAGDWGELLWTTGEGGAALCPGAVLKVEPSQNIASLASPGRARKSTHKWLQEMNVPPWWRSQLPVLIDNNDPVWVLAAGPLEGIAVHHRTCDSPGFKPRWRPFSAL
jgi:tRNA(Ile)-lysidine synthase